MISMKERETHLANFVSFFQLKRVKVVVPYTIETLPTDEWLRKHKFLLPSYDIAYKYEGHNSPLDHLRKLCAVHVFFWIME
jgi:hypothetical protein